MPTFATGTAWLAERSATRHLSGKAPRRRGALDYGWRELRLAKIHAGHHPDNRASRQILKQLGFSFLENLFYPPTASSTRLTSAIGPHPTGLQTEPEFL